MKIYIPILVAFLFVYQMNNLYSQETCKVLIPDLVGSYTGKCKNGLAHGKGIAEGKDRYEGKFKNGVPDGNGKYTWSTGDIYEGNWENGKKEGDGKLIFKVGGIDSVKIGIWKDDKFFRKIKPKPYTILKTEGITRNYIQRSSDGDKVLFAFMMDGVPNQGISDFSYTSNSGSSFNLGQKFGIENIIFPFKCRILYSTISPTGATRYRVEFEIEIVEPGLWEITLNN